MVFDNVLCYLLISYACVVSGAIKFEADGDLRSMQIQRGKEKLEEIQNTAKYSDCWKSALDDLHTTCRSMSDDQQRRLALAFANCHLQSSNRGIYPCHRDADISDCTSRDKMDDAAFQIYTEFFTHSNNMCYFLQSALWQDKTEGTINKLSDASEMAAEKLEQSLQHHQVLEEKQTLALKNQKAILDQDFEISQSLENTRSNMNQAFHEMHAKAENQKRILDDVLDKLQSGFGSIQWALSTILGEIITIETAGFFVSVVLLITFVPQFGASRLWLFGTLLFYGVFEGMSKKIFFLLVNASQPNSLVSLNSCLIIT